MGITGTLDSTTSSVPGWRPDTVPTVAAGLLARLLAAVLAVAAPVCALADGAGEAGGSSSVGEPVPQTLTLERALDLARGDHPAMAIAAAERMAAGADVELAAAARGWDSHLELDARAADKVAADSQGQRDDSRVTFYLSRLLTNFGGTSMAVKAAETRLAGADLALDYRAELGRIEVMRRFLGVRLADLRYFVDDEDMTLAFLRYDRLRERRERFGQFAEVEERELESIFRERLAARTAAGHHQRSARNRLALAMGRPGELALTVLEPDLSVYEREVPKYEEVVDEVLERHPLVRLNRILVEAAETETRSREMASRPELWAEFEATQWSLETGNRDELVAGFKLRVPIGGKSLRNARIAEAQALRHRLLADQRMLEFELRQEVLELVQRLQQLDVESEAARVNELYRDLYLDRSRTLYQLEARADLGDSQARQAEAVWRTASVEYERALTWARIDAMRGRPLAILNPEEAQ